MPSLWSWVRGFFGLTKAIPEVSEDSAIVGVDFGGNWGRQPDYDPNNANFAGTHFAWLYAATMRKSAAAASLPVEVYRLVGGKREVLADHWLYQLWEYPDTAGTPGILARRELFADLLLHGTAFLLIVGRPGPGCSLLRRHPKRMLDRTTEHGLVGYEYDAGGTPIPYLPEQVLCARTVGIGDDPGQFFRGVGCVQPLDAYLQIEWAATGRAQKASKAGRPALLATPKEGQTIPDAKVRREMAQKIAQDLRQFDVMVGSGAMDLREFGWSPEDLEFTKALEMVRQGTLAATGVPPVEMGLETANYATAREQSAKFWAGIKSDLELVDAAVWTRLLRLAGERDTYVRTVTEGVKELAAWRSDAWSRVAIASQVFYLSGQALPLADLLDAEGLADVAERIRRTQAAPPEPSAEDAERWFGSLGRHLRGLEPDRAPLPVPEDEPAPWPPTDEEARAAHWSALIERAHAPTERGIQVAASRFLRAEAERIAGKLRELGEKGSGPAVTKDAVTDALVEQIMAAIFDASEETRLLKASLDPATDRAFRQAVLSALSDLMSAGASLDQDRIDQLTEDLLGSKLVLYPLPGDSVTEITQATRDRVQYLVSVGLAEGQTTSEMATTLLLDSGFSPARALRIARTETTRAMGAGTNAAWNRTEDAVGITLRRQWLTSRDAATRDAHWVLDGQEVSRGQSFIVPASANGHVSEPQFIGAQADAPGGFGNPALDCNCRCVLLPIMAKAAEEAA